MSEENEKDESDSDVKELFEDALDTENDNDDTQDENDEEEIDTDEDEDVSDEDDDTVEEDVDDETDAGDDDESDVPATAKDQQDRMLRIIENMQKDKKGKEEKLISPTVDIYESEAYKAMLQVLDIDEDEGKIFMSFMQELQNDTQQKAVTQSLMDTPEVVAKYVNRNAVLSKLKTDFYNENPQLEEVSSYVAAIANEISAKDAGMAMDKVLDLAAKKTYKALGIKKEIVKSSKKSGGRKPAFAKGTKGSRKKTPKKDKLQQDIQDLMDV